LTLLDRAFMALETELTAEGKAAHLEVLKPWLVADADRGAQTVAAAQLGVSETAGPRDRASPSPALPAKQCARNCDRRSRPVLRSKRNCNASSLRLRREQVGWHSVPSVAAAAQHCRKPCPRCGRHGVPSLPRCALRH
jgi:hypothetical protein